MTSRNVGSAGICDPDEPRSIGAGRRARDRRQAFHAAQSRDCRRARRGVRLCRVLDRDDPGDGLRLGVAAVHAEPRQRQDHVQHRRLRVVPRRARTRIRRKSIARGSAAAWRSASPFGTFYVPNISPDPKDGIGAWSEADFVTALWDGTAPDGSHLFPAFPYPSYRHMELNDVRDLFAYLKTLPPVAGKVRDHDLAFPFNIRRLVGGWKLLFLKGGPFVSDPSQSAQWNRGAYLVNGPGHCAECHSPRNFLGGIIESERFAGGPSPDGKGWVPNITPAGLGHWGERQDRLVGEGHRELPRRRHESGRRFRRRRRWPRSWRTRRCSAPPTAPRSRLTLPRCRRSRAVAAAEEGLSRGTFASCGSSRLSDLPNRPPEVARTQRGPRSI